MNELLAGCGLHAPHLRFAVAGKAGIVLQRIERQVPARDDVDVGETTFDHRFRCGRGRLTRQAEDERTAAKSAQGLGKLRLLAQPEPLFLVPDQRGLVVVEAGPVAPFPHHVERRDLDDLLQQA